VSRWCQVIEVSVGSSVDGVHVTARDGRGVHVIGLSRADARWLAAKLLEEVERAERVDAPPPARRRAAPAPASIAPDEQPARRARR
jgi:hypothetical protein